MWLELEAKVIQPLATAANGYREIDRRFVQHPLGVVGLDNCRFRAEQGIVKIDTFLQIRYRNVYV